MANNRLNGGVSLERAQASQLRSYGDNLRRERMRQQLTQERLAEMVGLHPRTIQKIEAGKVNILITTFVRLQRALRCPWETLLGRP
jgi:transcriptional regulator with XRE-family HTH domain